MTLKQQEFTYIAKINRIHLPILIKKEKSIAGKRWKAQPWKQIQVHHNTKK